MAGSSGAAETRAKVNSSLVFRSGVRLDCSWRLEWLEVGILVNLRGLNLLRKEFGKIRLLFQQTNDLLEVRKNNNFLLKELSAGLDCRLSVPIGGYENPTTFRATKKTHKVLRDFRFANGTFIPLHFGKIKRALQFDDAVDLFDDSLPHFANDMKGIPNQHAVGCKNMVQCCFEFLSACLPRETSPDYASSVENLRRQ
jgi:hypothetical protein